MACEASPRLPLVVGILNLSRDSFSDGGDYCDPLRAAERVEELFDAGAHWVELGAASSHPDAAEVSAADEIAQLERVLDHAGHRLDRLGVDTWKPEVQRFCLQREVAFLNDIAGFGDERLYPDLAASDCALVVMHSTQQGKATRAKRDGDSIVDQVGDFLVSRAGELVDAGVARERIIVDPGMGFFLADTPQPSFDLLAATASLRRRLALPMLVSVSRKSFLGAVTGRDVGDRGPATLAAELYAAGAGVDYIRTHDVAALVDGLAVSLALVGSAAARKGGTDDGF